MTAVHEIAVRMVKPSAHDAFLRRRAAFIKKLKTQKGVGADREFESFFALPQPDERAVFIGMTTYEGLSAVNHAQLNPLVMARFLPFFMTMDLKAYVFAEQIEGPALDLAQLAASPQNVLHVTVRRTAAEAEGAFRDAHARFYETLMARDGVGPHYELRAVKGNGDIEGVSVGLTVYEDQEALASAYEALVEDALFLEYVQTFEAIASQFARSTTNT